MYFKLMSGDVISADSVEELSSKIGVPAFRIHLIESEVIHDVVVQDHPHDCDIEYLGDGDYMIRVKRYVGGFFAPQNKEEEDWNWDTWEIYFSGKSPTIPEDMPEDTVEYMMGEVRRLYSECKGDEGEYKNDDLSIDSR